MIDTVEHKYNLKKCGLTEWVLTRKSTVDKVREKFKARDLDGLDGCWETWETFVLKLQAILHELDVYITTDTEMIPLSLWVPHNMH